ncbi:carbohydrate sulfotransferase 11-like isoform X1 [Macrobrachium nipponense]|uniref:carbohydrate sulfotransferase 11-like isoform X1 n=1 Tax=Macrobrachium nipponense TaxID=159736 RepID=UPI0030C7E8B7
MFPRLGRLPRRVVLTCVYVYCLLLIYRISDSKEYERKRLDSVKRSLRERAQLIKAECIAHPPPLTKSQKNAQVAAAVDARLSAHYTKTHLKLALNDILYLPRNNISWCIVPKVASTSWSKSLLELAGYTENDLLYRDKPLQTILRDTYRPVKIDNINKTLGNSVKFLFVRHPFQRLVSAYRNKLEDSYKEEDGQYFYNNYGRNMVAKFRVNEKKENQKALSSQNAQDDKDSDPTEAEFRREPTFVEYVDYLINTDVTSYDEHWKPIWLQCHVCDFDYDYIIKYENFEEEIGLFINILKGNGQLPSTFALQWENRGGTSANVTRQYLKQISDRKLWRLYEKYRHDFGYFGYTMEDYLNL